MEGNPLVFDWLVFDGIALSEETMKQLVTVINYQKLKVAIYIDLHYFARAKNAMELLKIPMPERAGLAAQLQDRQAIERKTERVPHRENTRCGTLSLCFC